MKRLTHHLFPTEHQGHHYSLVLLALRLLFGGLLLAHGLDKWIHFYELEAIFPDPLGVGSRFSLMLCIFAEVICSCFVILGLLTRVMLIPIVLSMLVALLAVHHGQPFMARELPFLHLMLFLLLMITGPGRYSCDFFIGTHRLRRIEE